MARALTIQEVVEKIKAIHGDTVVLDESTYINTHTKCRFIDKDFGEWMARPQKVLIGRGNPKRAAVRHKKRMKDTIVGIDIIKSRIKDIHGDTISIDETTYVDSKTKCRFIDCEYGEWWAVPGNIISSKTQHPYRGELKRIKSRQITPANLKQLIQDIHGDTVTIDLSTYKNIHSPAKFIDKDYGEWWTCPSSVIHQKCGHRTRGLKKLSENSTISVDTIKKRISQIHGDTVCLDESTYINVETKCRFIDKDFGEWFTSPSNIIYAKSGHPKKAQEKSASTCFSRFGVRNPLQNHEIALKVARSGNKSFIEKHWRTGEEVICTASYEKKTVEYLNKNKIDYDWQPKTFDVIIYGKAKTYRPDCYLPEQDKWIEIKGYFREDAKEKWDFFQKNIHPNSELWNKEKLKELGIL